MTPPRTFGTTGYLHRFVSPEAEAAYAGLGDDTRAVYNAVVAGLYGEPCFSDVVAEDVIARLGRSHHSVNAALGVLYRAGLLYRDEYNGNVFLTPTAWDASVENELEPE